MQTPRITPFAPGETFRSGEVWESPRGLLYRIERVEREGKQIIARMVALKSGRSAHRSWDAVSGWTLRDDLRHD